VSSYVSAYHLQGSTKKEHPRVRPIRATSEQRRISYFVAKNKKRGLVRPCGQRLCITQLCFFLRDRRAANSIQTAGRGPFSESWPFLHLSINTIAKGRRSARVTWLGYSVRTEYQVRPRSLALHQPADLVIHSCGGQFSEGKVRKRRAEQPLEATTGVLR
jgi:hypothetical protein